MKGEWRWSFTSPHRGKSKRSSNEEDEGSLITVTDSRDPVLVAVTKKQYKSWSKQEVTVVKRPALQLLKAQSIRVRNFLANYKHFWMSNVGGYLYIRVFCYCIIISLYGIRLIKPRRQAGLSRSLHEYYQLYPVCLHRKKRGG